MPERRAALERLSRRFGIAPDYHDMWGVRHDVADENLVALLAAFDVDASSDAAIAAAEHAAEAATWHEALPPVAALAVGDAHWSVALRLRQSVATLRWTIEEEEGARHHGDIDATALASTAQAELDGVSWRECRLAPGVALPAGYHRLHVDGVPGSTLLIAAPPRCHRPSALDGDGRVWGPALQLYALRSEQNWGIGDFGDLARVIEQWAARGAGIVGLNPLHALFSHNPRTCEPVQPVVATTAQPAVHRRRGDRRHARMRAGAASRALGAVPGAAGAIARSRRSRLSRRRGGQARSARAPVCALSRAPSRGRQRTRTSVPRVPARRAATRCGSTRCTRRCRRTCMRRTRRCGAGRCGPKGGASPHRPRCNVTPRSRSSASSSTSTCSGRPNTSSRVFAPHCRARGLAIGLYLDLAVSVDRAGSDTWSHAHTYAPDASVGAPPDDFNRQGQNWGLPPLRPDHLRASGYRVFIDTLRANMRHAGALRIDHVMGLMRLFWIPPARGARDGAYVHYRADELLAIVALESQRNRCLVIGEDLGTVPDEIRHALAERGVLSYRLMYFERDGAGAFKPPRRLPARRAGRRVDARPADAGRLVGRPRHRVAQSSRPVARPGRWPTRCARARGDERRRLLEALQRAGLAAQADVPPLEAAHAYLGATPSAVMVLQLEDVLGVVEQANLPGTVDEHPNWRRKLPCDLDAMAAVEPLQRVAATLARLRPHAPLQPPSSRAVDARCAARDLPAAVAPRLHVRRCGARAAVPGAAGRSHVYCSPITRARAGSLHGYDVVAHDEINPELGGREGFDRFAAALRAHGLGLLLDLVPNHMGVFGADNAWWSDVLENGPASLYAQHFDIDWHPLDRALDGKVLLPVLGDHYGHVLDRGELRLAFEPERGGFAVRYHEHRFPLDVRGYADVAAPRSSRPTPRGATR